MVSNQRKRWQSYNRKGIIRLNWRIIQTPIRLMDHVVIHELVHLCHRGHSHDYWQAATWVMPDYERWWGDLRRRRLGLSW